MATKKQIQNIKTNFERTVQGLTTISQEFIYEQNKGTVRGGEVYSIYYTLDKKEIYLTGTLDSLNTKIIERLKNKTLYGRYSEIKELDRIPYPVPTPAKPSKSDYEIGEITRYFTRVANNTSALIFEISLDDFEIKNSLYKYTSFTWKISGLKSEVVRENSQTIRRLEKDYSGIGKILNSTNLWAPPKNSTDDVKNKLKRRKIN